MEFAVNVPINSTSFGQVSTAILRELYKEGAEPSLFPVGGSASLDSQDKSDEFETWIKGCVEKAFSHSRKNPCLKIWHLSGSLQSFSEKQALFTFHETSAPTAQEINIAKNNKVFVSNNYTAEIFKSHNVEVGVIPLGFDSNNFTIINKKYFDDDRITFNLCGKFERRKHHKKVIQAWLKKYGNNSKYYLQCALHNNFFSPEENKEFFKSCLEDSDFFNIQFLSHIPKNKNYNDFLNSSNIVIGMSGGEGWGLPEFQSVALGKHAVILNAHGYKEWANEINSVLVEPSGEIESHDGMFFNKGDYFNQGTFFDWNEDDFIDGCEKAIKRHEISQVNEEGIVLQKNFTYKKTTDKLLEELEKM
jgi:hypothetical protein